MQAWNYQKFLEEGAIALCNSNTSASLQESPDLNSELKLPEQTTSPAVPHGGNPQDRTASSKLNSSLKTTTTLNESLNTDSLISSSTATSKTITPRLESSTSIQLDFLALEPVVQVMEQDLTTQNQNSGLSHCDASPMAAPVSSSLKILKELSTKDYKQFLADSEWSVISGMIHSSYRQRKLERRTKEIDSSSLPTPTTYCKGSTGCRPAGATRLEQKLRPYIIKGDKLNPAVPGWMMGFPVGWAEWPLMDTGETISVQLPFIPEYATTSINDAIVTTSTPDQSAPSRQQLQSNESAISPISPKFKQSDLKLDLYICNSSFITKFTGGSIPPADFALNVGKITEVWQTCFTVNWSGEIKCYFWERDDQVIGELAIAPQHLITKFLEEKAGYEATPENFLEESEPQPVAVQKTKSRQRKGCLYKYIENKKLKSGAIASYPRVIGHRQLDNPTHWRWGYNWEIKDEDGEWKGRSIGSVPLGAVPMIQSMQREGASLEEIIGFIKRAKAKKS